jgi:hypothetical protein
MVRLKSLRGRPIAAQDGDIGWVADVYFDDRTWSVRYFVLDTGKPMPQRQVLVPAAQALYRDSRLHAQMTRAQIEKFPEMDADRPVYLQHDMASIAAPGDRHLRSADVVSGCAVSANDGVAGHTKDLLADPDTWRIAWLDIDTGVWLPGRRVLLAPAEVVEIDWLDRRMRTRLSRAEIRAAPPSDVTRQPALTHEEGRAEDRPIERVP